MFLQKKSSNSDLYGVPIELAQNFAHTERTHRTANCFLQLQKPVHHLLTVLILHETLLAQSRSLELQSVFCNCKNLSCEAANATRAICCPPHHVTFAARIVIEHCSSMLELRPSQALDVRNCPG